MNVKPDFGAASRPTLTTANGGPGRLNDQDLRLVKFLQGIRLRDLPEPVVETARWRLIDLAATAVAGSRMPASGIIARHAARHFAAGAGARPSRPLLGGAAMSPPGAAMVGGMMIDSLDAHDGHSLTKGHIGCGVLPALAAIVEAERPEMPESEFVALLVAGYEIGTRAGIALHRSVPDYHSSGAWIAVACAALASHVLGLDNESFRHALGIAEYHGPRSQMMRNVDHPTMVKDGSGWGSMAGLSAAYLAQDGFTGAPAVSIVADDLLDLWADLGTKWRILEQYTKPYPVCRWAHAGIDAVRELMTEHRIEPERITAVSVHTFHEATRLYQGLASTTDEAQYGIAVPTALAILHGDVHPEHILDGALADPALAAMTGRVRLVEDPAYSARFPAERMARAEIRLDDGRVLVSGPRQPRGDPADPLSQEEITTKYFAYAEASWSRSKTETVFEILRLCGAGTGTVAALLTVLRE